MTTIKKLWIGIGILALLSPFGLLLPRLIGAGGAWGEWTPEEVREMTGFMPEGMRRLTKAWSSPLADYTIPGQGGGMGGDGLGYLIAAVLGIAIIAAVMFLLSKLLSRKKGT